MISFSVSNILLMIQIIMAELVFLYHCPKRKKFILRLACTIGLCILLSYFFPMLNYRNVFYDFFRFNYFFLITAAGMIFCFNIKIFAIISLCVSGYAVQHFAHRLSILIFMNPSVYIVLMKNYDFASVVLTATYYPLINLAAYFIFGRLVKKYEYYTTFDKLQSIIAIILMLVCTGISRFIPQNVPYSVWIATSLYAMTCCIFALIVQFYIYRKKYLESEASMIKQLWLKDKDQYSLTKANIDTINIKCHDIKYKLSAYKGRLPDEELDSLQMAVSFYDSVIKTGNEVLDTILTEKTFLCEKENINITFMGDGKLLEFISAVDAYSLFGNAIDNAIEASLKIEDKEKRVINFTVEQRGEFLFITVMNYFNSEINYYNGYLKSTKDDEKGYHGFGIKSMQIIANKYAGNIDYSQEQNIFTLSIWLHKPDYNK